MSLGRSRDEDGFTLIELLVVIIIIGILASIAAPVFLSQRRKGYDAQAKEDLHSVAEAEEAALAEFGSYANVIVNGPEPATPVMGTSYYVKSQNTSVVSAEYVSASGTLTGATPSAGYCLATTSDSGKVFSYLSTQGQLLTGNACP